MFPNSARIDIADSGNLNFKKTDDRGNGLANAVFGITSKDNKENVLTKTSVSDKNGIVSFDNLPVGKYILKEITAPDLATQVQMRNTMSRLYLMRMTVQQL